MGRFTINSKLGNWDSNKAKDLDFSLLSMVTDIHRVAVMNAPHLTGALQYSGKVKKTATLSYEVAFGDSRVPYALRRHYENKKNPQTIGYLKNAGKSITANIGKYFKG